MEVFRNLSELVPANASIPDNISLVQCPMKFPMSTWDPSSFTQAAMVSTILATVVNIITMPFTVFFNAVVIYVVWKNTSLHVERIVVLAYLALTDLLVGLIIQPLHIAREVFILKTNELNCEIHSAYILLAFLLLVLANQELVVVTCDRYVAIIHPFQYPTRITVKRLTSVFIGLWAVNIALAILYLVLLAFDASVWYINIFHGVMGTTSIILMIYWYVRMFAAIRRQNHQIAQQQQNINLDNRSQTQRPKPKGAMTAALLLVCFLASFIPLLAGFFVTEVLGLRAVGSLRPWVVTFVHLGSFINPIIYGQRVGELKAKCRQLFGFERFLSRITQ